ncbi:MAG: DUF4446 family protein [Candidatus Niyogibacteria bacterium]|nr:DUF4446 family protein [Candidatus Niyogibacteria bacterium]
MKFFNEDIVYFAAGTAIAAILIFIWLIILEWRLKKLFKGSDGRDLMGILTGRGKELNGLKKRMLEIEKYLQESELRLQKSLKNVGLVRFDSFEGVGGKQSFSAAFLDENKNGTVISSLYGRDFNRIYAKPVESGISSHSLSEEEKEAIKKAISE